MTDTDLREACITELKRLYPEPWFVEWGVFAPTPGHPGAAYVSPHGSEDASEIATCDKIEQMLSDLRSRPTPEVTNAQA